MIHILDVSEFQGQVDWGRVAKVGIAGAIHKATQYRIDYQHERNHKGIPDAGLPHGCYHFLVSDVAAAPQVTLYAGAAGPGFGDFPPVIDFEKFNGWLPTADQLDAFLGLLAYHTNRRPLLYGNTGDLATLGTRFIGRVDVWLADYGPNNGHPNGDPNAKRASTQFPPGDVKMWQYTSVGQVDGVYGHCDLSLWLGTQAELDTYVNPQPLPQPEPAPQPQGGDNMHVSAKIQASNIRPDGSGWIDVPVPDGYSVISALPNGSDAMDAPGPLPVVKLIPRQGPIAGSWRVNFEVPGPMDIRLGLG